jgi:tRNA-splicing ligase RtcB
MQVIKDDSMIRPIKAWTDDIEETALTQAKNLARLPFIAGNGVALMPDVHAGKGSTVGSVIATEKAVIPAAVGVDIGCGMNAVRLSLKASDLPDSLAGIRDAIEQAVPLGAGGRHQRNEQVQANAARLNINDVPESVAQIFGGARQKALDKAVPQLGSLGSGNHFIELCLDENHDVWIMLHSGSRGIGNMIGTHFISKAKRTMEKFRIHLPDGDLAYIPEETEDFDDYMDAVQWAQDYALENRKVMMMATIAALRKALPIDFTITQEAINCHHNYVDKENHFGKNLWVTRKGAIRARDGDLGIIPGSMGQKSYIVRGKGNLQSYCSCSHGAGRQMSRAKARQTFTVDDLRKQTEGVECRKDDAVLDEIPGAYKDIDTVMSNQTDLVEVVHTLKQVMCIKGN